MNYRHAYHAGNHTEVFKHAVLIFLLEHLLQKDKPFMVLDTHAGIGVYDLEANEAMRTGEKAEGVERILPEGLLACPAYAQLIRSLNKEELRYYPGSPEIIRRMLRKGDRLVACELHDQDFLTLQARYGRDASVRVQNRSGYEAVKALLPPPERRGLVFIDPPYERKDELQALTRALSNGMRRWATGIFCVWYPIKDRLPGDVLTDQVISAGYPKSVRIELLPYRYDGIHLAGSGLILCNTPWRLAERAEQLCVELVTRLGEGEGTWSVDWLNA